MDGATTQLANFVISTPFEDLPADALTLAKEAILDCMGVTLAGRRTDVGEAICQFVKECGGAPDAGVVASGFLTSAPDAALANGTMAHALDYDDVCIPMLGHPTVPILPAVLALAEKLGSSGNDVIAAYIMGVEVEIRLAMAMNPEHYQFGWHSTSVLGTMGAAAAASRLLELTPEQAVMAMGIAASQAGGSRKNFGTATKPFHAGCAARAGVVSAELALRGFTAEADILDERFGFFQLFGGGVMASGEILLEGLGDTYCINRPGLGVKLYPSCTATHTAVDAIIQIMNEHDLDSQRIESITCGVSQLFVDTMMLIGEPKTGLEGKFSLEYCIASAATHRRLRLAHFSDGALAHTEVQRIMEGITVIIDPEIPEDESSILETMPAIITVTLEDGAEYKQRVDNAKGTPSNPVEKAAIVEKFHECVSGILSGDKADRCVNLIENFENLETVSVLMDIVTHAR